MSISLTKTLFLVIPIFFISLCEATDFNEAFAVSVVANVKKLVSLPWTRVNNILFSAYNSRWSYLYSGDGISSVSGPDGYVQYVDSNHTREFLWSLFKPFEYEDSSSVDMIYCGFENGKFIGYSTASPGNLYWEVDGNNSCPSLGFDKRCREFYSGDSVDSTTGQISGEMTSAKEYDPRWRPWYTGSQEGGSIWTAPYIFSELEVLGITAAKQIVTDSGDFIGVIGTDYTLATIETTLSTLIEQNEEFFLFIVDNNGALIAASESGVAVDKNSQQIQANVSTNLLVSEVSQVIERNINEDGIGGWVKANGTIMTVDITGQGLYWAQSIELRDEYGLHWHVVIVEQVLCETGSFVLNKEQVFSNAVIHSGSSQRVVCATCPEGAECVGGNKLPFPKHGYWSNLDTSLVKFTLHKCVRNTCQGFRKRTKKEASLSYDTLLELCFIIDGDGDDKACLVDELVCDVGSTGPLCGSCLQSYRYSAISKTCVMCNSNKVSSYWMLITCFSVFFLIALLRCCHFKIPTLIWNSWLVMVFRNLFKTGSLKVMISTYQIIEAAATSLEIEYPSLFSVSLRYLSFLNMNIPGLECNGIGVYDRVYVSSLSPLVIALVIVIIGELRLISTRRLKIKHDEIDNVDIVDNEMLSSDVLNVKNKCNRIKAQHAWSLLFLSYLVLPPTAGVQLKAIDCFKIPNSDGQRVLRIDTSISCNSHAHKQFEIINICLIAIYFAIPMIWLLLLRSQRSRLFPIGIQDDSIIIQRRRLEDKLIRLKFLFERYRPNMYFFEAVDVNRRILLVGVVPLLASSSLTRAAIGAGISLLFLVMNRELSPYVSEETNLVAYIADIVIYLTFASALMIETGLDNGLNNLVFGLILILINVSILITAVTAALFRTMLDKENRYKRKEKYLKHVEDASDFTSHKFAATFHEINRTLITPSHCSLLFYASLVEIKHILRHGIPVCDKYTNKGSERGIVFTMHQPHSLDDEDRQVFQSSEAFVVVSLPRRLLKHYIPTSRSGSNTSALWIFPLGVLNAMRGTYFEDIIDPTLFEQGVLLLPPQCIKRAYQLDASIASKPTNRDDKSLYRLKDKNSIDVDKESKTISSSLQLYQPEYFPMSTDKPIEISKIKTYLSMMSKVRSHCAETGLTPLFHYTQVELATMIMKGGFKMSTQGQGDGGVYFSTLGPASYDIGSPHYEENVIIDCFGREKLDSMRGLHKVDMCLVYGVDPLIAEKVTASGSHTMVVPQEYFHDFNLSNPDGSYFLRSDRSLACFRLDGPISGLDDFKQQIELERIKDVEVTNMFLINDKEKKLNEKLIGSLWSETSPQVHIEWAVTYGPTKFSTLLNKLEKSFSLTNSNNSYNLFFHYGTLAEISKYVRCGVPVLKQASSTSIRVPNVKSTSKSSKYMNESKNDSKGIFFTKHHPDQLSDEEIQLFGNCEAFVACLLPNKLLFPHTAVKKKRMSSNDLKTIQRVRSLRNEHSIIESKTDETASLKIQGSLLKSDLYYLPIEVLSAMRGQNFEKLLDPTPWYENILLLPPQCIKAAYQVISDENIDSIGICVLNETNCVIDKPLYLADSVTSPDNNQVENRNPMAPPSSSASSSSSSSKNEVSIEVDAALPEKASSPVITLLNIEPFSSVETLKTRLDIINQKCRENGLLALFHYTDYRTAQIVLENGFKVSTQGLAEGSDNGGASQGGVYFSTKEPTLYSLANGRYEDDIITDFYGSGVLGEFRGRNKVDVCIVYGMSSIVIGNDVSDNHLKLLPRSMFKDFCLLHEDNNYYLRNDHVLGAFLLSTPSSSTSQPLEMSMPSARRRSSFR